MSVNGLVRRPITIFSTELITIIWGSAFSSFRSLVEAVQEFKVHTGLSSVEFGRSAGAQVNVATNRAQMSFTELF